MITPKKFRGQFKAVMVVNNSRVNHSLRQVLHTKINFALIHPFATTLPCSIHGVMESGHQVILKSNLTARKCFQTLEKISDN